MTGKERILRALRFEEPDRPPHFESMFELEYEAFGLCFPERTRWARCARVEKERMIAQCMEIYARIVETYAWDALAVYWPWGDPEGVAAAKRTFGERIAIGGMVGGGVWAIEAVTDWARFATDLLEAPERIHAEAEAKCRVALDLIDRMVDAGADFVFMPHDVAFNAGPFISPAQFAEFVAPYWTRLVRRVTDRGALAFIHTDGQIMPILDQLVGLQAHCLQSIDPMAGVDIAEVKKLTYGRLALMGNVQCNLLQDGPIEAIRASALYCLEHASPGGGYIFSTSNTVFPGMPLSNYEYMLDVFREFTRARPGS
ncbi:MAG TPA: uroporphyrinogen decarboxylase family protein [Candidatus Hydrogenedentes bacterium]|nr:uroporphyrinogen decarboxylase family protein [Candidatus Hydrogenedentota bacterium]HPG69684.1 uroporphyrinogen decarboxylase family protein [Candidatus Hydrogenedentota bacterium]